MFTTGPTCFQLPADLIYVPMASPLDGAARRVFAWILWDAAHRDLWKSRAADGSFANLVVRRSLAEIRDGAGFTKAKDFAAVRGALETLEATNFVYACGTPVRMITGLSYRHRRFAEFALPAELIEVHSAFNRYALLDMAQIRRLKKPLDFSLYERARLSARKRRPSFELCLEEIGEIVGLTTEPSWSALRDPLLGASARVAAALGMQFQIEASQTGEFSGVDFFRFTVRPLATVIPVQSLKRKPGSMLFVTDSKGSYRLS